MTRWTEMKKAPIWVLFSALSLAKNLTVNIGAIAQFGQ